MPFIMVDVEADGPCPGRDMFSMVQLGAVVVEPGLTRRFFGKFKPISLHFRKEYLKAIGLTREETMRYPEASQTMLQFHDWLTQIRSGGKKTRPISDNPGFDASFTTYYFELFTYGLGPTNPLGHTCAHLGSLARGAERDLTFEWKSLRKTPHTHDPVQDALGNAEVLLTQAQRYGWNLDF